MTCLDRRNQTGRPPDFGCPSMSILYPCFWKRWAAVILVRCAVRGVSPSEKAQVIHSIYIGIYVRGPHSHFHLKAIGAWPYECGM